MNDDDGGGGGGGGGDDDEPSVVPAGAHGDDDADPSSSYTTRPIIRASSATAAADANADADADADAAAHVNIFPTDDEILGSVDCIQTELIAFASNLVNVDSTLTAGESNAMEVAFDTLSSLFLADEKKEDQQQQQDNGPRSSSSSSSSSPSRWVVERVPVNLESIRHLHGYSPVDWEYHKKYNVVARYRPPQPPSASTTTAGETKAETNATSAAPIPSTSTSTSASTSSGGKSLILQGHMDVVPATSSSHRWTTPPFRSSVRHNRLYGRGSGDMKGGIAAMIYALVALHRLGYAPASDVTVQLVFEEECTGNGALALVASGGSDEGRLADAVVIPEPFPFLVTAQLGVLWFRTTVTGKPVHVLDATSGTNAIEGAYKLYGALRELEVEYNRPENKHPAYADVDHPIHFNLGVIEGGDWASSVPSSCRFEVRVGFFPNQTLGDVKADVERTLETAAKEHGLTVDIAYRGFQAEGAVLLDEYVSPTPTTVAPPTQQVSAAKDAAGGKPPSEEDEDDGGGKTESGRTRKRQRKTSLQREYVELMRRCHRSVTGSSSEDLPLRPITCTTDCRFYALNRPGADTPAAAVCSCYGPEASNIHGIDESVCLQSLRDVTAVLALFVRDWCGLQKVG